MINFKDAAKYYSNLAHQNKAWDYLQLSIDKDVLEEFTKLYRAETPTIAARGVIIDRIQALGFKLELGKAYIVGVEGVGVDYKANSDELDIWNDIVLVLKINKDRTVTQTGPFKATTEPGKYYTANPMSPLGSARVLTDSFNKDIWIRGTHIRQPNCLIQSGAEVEVTRDSNKDGKRGSSERLEKGYFGINLHHTGSDAPGNNIGRWSAGCTVIAKKSEHQLAMAALPKEQLKFSYILLDGSKVRV